MQIELSATRQAYQAFSDVCQALSPIATDANDYPTQIANFAIQSTAGTTFAGYISDWTTNFNQLWNVLQQITNQVETQYLTMLATNAKNTDLAGGVSG
jgi:uncharacterized protein YukE